MSNVIAIDQIRKAYGKKVILDGLSMVIPKGSVVGLLGKNGAGKTTLIKALLGLVSVNSGSILTLGENPWNLSDKAKANIGYVQQGMRPYPWLQVGKLIDYTASFYSKWNSYLVDRLIKQWSIDLSVRVGILSEGEMQKLLIILALAHEPDLMVFDEPVASLDPASRREFLKTILDIILQRECTVFFSTHITSDLERVADTVAVLKNGKIDFFGGLDDLKDIVKRIRIRSHKDLPRDFGISGVVSSIIKGNEAIVTVRGFNEIKHQALLRDIGGDIEIEHLNLEEIFLEITQ